MTGTRDRPRQIPAVGGVIAGQAAWLVGSLVTAAVVLWADHRAVFERAVGDAAPPPEPYQLVAWVVANAHLVPVRVNPAFEGEPVESFTVNLLGGTAGFTPLLLALPVATLVLAGGALAWWAGCRSPADGLLAGLTVVPGYFVLAVAGRLVSTMAWAMGPGGTAAPAVAWVLATGLAYPSIFAGGAGLLVGTVRSLTDTSGEATGSDPTADPQP